MKHPTVGRRTALRILGAGLVGGTTLGGTASAEETGTNRRQDSFAWAQGNLMEMLEAEPHPISRDSEGNEEAHRPLWIIATMEGTDVAGSEHSPHPNPEGSPIDHVVPLVDFSAQWHVLTVHEAVEDENGETIPGPLTNYTDSQGYLTSASAIRGAKEDGDVVTVETPIVFTCPIRPHRH